MKALTITQPWATLVANGSKRIETRSFAIKYRGPIAIHAAKGFPGWAKATCEESDFLNALKWPHPEDGKLQMWMDAIASNLKALPRGEVVATATLVDCLPVELIELYSAKATINPGAIWRGTLTEKERFFGDYSEGRFGWLLKDIKPITPTPAKGALGLWNWEPGLSIDMLNRGYR